MCSHLALLGGGLQLNVFEFVLFSWDVESGLFLRHGLVPTLMIPLSTFFVWTSRDPRHCTLENQVSMEDLILSFGPTQRRQVTTNASELVTWTDSWQLVS